MEIELFRYTPKWLIRAPQQWREHPLNRKHFRGQVSTTAKSKARAAKRAKKGQRRN
jgi:hypothetical protein